MNQICYYTCNLLPPGFLAHAGHLPRPLLQTPARQHAPLRSEAAPRDAADRAPILPHANTCPFAVSTIDAGERTLAEDQSACLVVPTGCDAMRRAGDALAARYPDRVRALLVPRTDDSRAVSGLARDLEALLAWLESRTPADENVAIRTTTSVENAPAPPAAQMPVVEGPVGLEGTFAYPAPPAPGGVFVVGGPLSHGVLLEAVLAAGVSVSGVESCRGPECATRLTALEACASTPAEVAAGILESATCPRSGALRRREFLQDRLRTTGAAAVLYARLPFCDPGAYDALLVRSLAQEEGLPFLEMEVDYPLEMAGPLRVRLEAFLETLTLDASLLDDEDGLFADPEQVVVSSGAADGSVQRGPGPG
ncbi:MAG: 2-hydroxyacyl-CoA dehydratase family protein, partial [Thermoleophilia bacterium]